MAIPTFCHAILPQRQVDRAEVERALATSLRGMAARRPEAADSRHAS